MQSGNHSEGVESQPQATLCSNGCGFFANVGTSGMCSKCFRENDQAAQRLEAVAKSTAAAVAPQQPPAPVPTEAAAQSQAEQPAVPAPVAAAEVPPPAPPSSTRCNIATCRKKLGLTGFKCRCGHSFCGQHRGAEDHECTFDYKTFERLKIEASNPLVQAAKVQKL